MYVYVMVGSFFLSPLFKKNVESHSSVENYLGRHELLQRNYIKQHCKRLDSRIQDIKKKLPGMLC